MRTMLAAEDFHGLFAEVSNWERWGEGDERGALHHLTAERVAAAAGLVRSGATVTLSRALETVRRIHCPQPGRRPGRSPGEVHRRMLSMSSRTAS